MKTALLLSWLACQSLDLGTTHYGLTHHFPTPIREGNRINGQALRRIYAIKVSGNLALLLVYRVARKHPERVVIPVTLAAAGCTAGVLNLRTISRASRP